MRSSSIQWPDGKDFAFTIFDDTDLQTLENAREVYSYLAELGFRTTKSVWPIRGGETPSMGGLTCEDREYLDWVLGLKNQDFEIALHNVTYHTSRREDTQRGIERFRELFGHYPHTLANHAGCREALYWGSQRLSGIRRGLFEVYWRLHRKPAYSAHLESSELFWGDICRDTIQYVRGFTSSEINTLKFCPYMPYHDPSRPFVKAWFAAYLFSGAASSLWARSKSSTTAGESVLKSSRATAFASARVRLRSSSARSRCIPRVFVCIPPFSTLHSRRAVLGPCSC